MNVEFKDGRPEPVLIEDVIVNGVRVGTVEPGNLNFKQDRYRYHATIQLEGLAGISGLLQGYGATKEAAIKNAVDSSRSNALNLLAKLVDFELKLFA